MNRAATLILRAAEPADDWAVRQLFLALHTYNAALDARFALAEGWERVLDEHLTHTRNAGHGLTLLGWVNNAPLGLLMMDGHTDSPLFRHRRWAELLALYCASEAKGLGLADALVEAGLHWARERGFERVQLYCTVSNVRARQFYARAGFRPVQEIWRHELGVVASPLPAEEYAGGTELLAPHQHLLGQEGE